MNDGATKAVPTIEKDVLYPGVYTLRGGGRFECPAKYIFQAAANGNRMLRAGNTAAPVIWEHDWEVVPQPIPVLLSALADADRTRDWAAGFARHTFGFVKGYRVGTEKGEPVLWAAHHVPDANDAAQFEKTKFVSPRVDVDYTDFNGRYWPGCVVGHVAATPNPVQMKQRPVMLSGAARPRPGTSRRTVFLSLGGSDMADDNGSKKGDEGGGNARLKSAVQAYMSANGHSFPEGCNTPDEMALVLETLAAQGGGGGGDLSAEDDLGADASGAGTDAAVTPAMLSGLPKPIQDAARKGIADQKAELTRMLDHVQRVGVPAGSVTAKRCQQMRAAIGGLSDGALLSMVGGKASSSPLLVELRTLARVHGYKRPAAQLSALGGGDPPTDVDEVAIAEPSKGAGASMAEIDAARQRVKDRHAGKVPPIPGTGLPATK